jgi:O-antigen ligase
MKSPTKSKAASIEPRLLRLFAVLFGIFLGLTLLKFPNPPIFGDVVAPPTDIYQFVLTSWPILWAYGLLAAMAVLGLLVAKWNANAPRWLVALPLAWLIWQLVASLHSVDVHLSYPTVAHLLACTVCFYLGYFSLSRVRSLSGFWVGLIIAFLLVLAVGWQQQFGGLAQMREFFQQTAYLDYQAKGIPVPPEYLKKLESTRIFSTLFYPNALAGALLLFLPVMLGLAAQTQRFTLGARCFLVAVIGIAALACLYWSGSKGGWLLMLLLGLLFVLQLPFNRRYKITLLAVALVLGLSGFVWKNAGFFRKGAPSVSARIDYWHAGFRTAIANPLFGTGPGTFSIPYRKLRRPEAEPSKLAHNDYLEQASDSGWPGFLAYAAFIVTALAWSAPSVRRDTRSVVGISNATAAAGGQLPGRRESGGRLSNPKNLVLPNGAGPSGPVKDWTLCLIWLGLVGWSLQGLMEFGLYIPSLAWPAFTLLGLVLGRKAIDNPAVPG